MPEAESSSVAVFLVPKRLNGQQQEVLEQSVLIETFPLSTWHTSESLLSSECLRSQHPLLAP